MIAFFMTPDEVRAFIALLLIWQGYNCLQSLLDNGAFAHDTEASTAFLVCLYSAYLFVLASCIWIAYEGISPFASEGDYLGLLDYLWRHVFHLLVWTVGLGIVGNLIAHLITDRDIVRSE